MNEDMVAVNPRRLVVYFDWDHRDYLPDMIQDDKGIRPQLVHLEWIRPLPAPSRLERISSFLGLKLPPSKASKEVSQHNDQAIASAHGFVSLNYRPGDQVILLTIEMGVKEAIRAMEILGRHLHDGTTPGKPSTAQPGGENIAPRRRISIHALVVIGAWWEDVDEGMPWIDDELKARFPPGIEQIIYYVRHDRAHWCCSTVWDLDGGIVSREVELSLLKHRLRSLITSHCKICIYNDDKWSWLRLLHGTKHIIHYKPEELPDWDEQKPVWNKVLHSSPSGIPRNFPSSTLPAGIYQQELSRYQSEPEWSHRLVWKSFRN
ncbi:unnamed protein product [Rhizoctonia solani]|uniref:Uncharacterized protein n=1 Tax=Rhizoctonia solani TaxID=456999 RepID=A0A8H3BRI7_9AGAM|nr:unnamed protein product [Rhizoctonia solani]